MMAVLPPAGHSGGLTFAHSLLRAAAYRRIRETLRREVHKAAAAICDSVAERAWHLAETADGPDETVAGELEQAVRQR